MHLRRLALALTAATALTAALAGCSSSGSDATTDSVSAAGSGSSSTSAVSGAITVFAAASLTGSFTTLGEQFEQANPGTKVTFNFGASSTLATQITQGAPADVFASASPTTMQTVVDAKAAGTPTNFVSNSGEIAVAKGNPGGVTSLADLAKSGVTVAVCQPQVPCGKLATTIFSNAGITVKPVTQEADVKSTLAKITAGAVDAGIVYVTDVKAAGDAVQGIEIPADQNSTTEYPIATLTGSGNADLAEAFTAYVLSADGQKVLTDAGFAAP
ncbi:molybdate ABC transporter substrate-binding protein [Jatrophihabitans sp. YIM 134969]